LSKARADAVAAVLVEQGVPARLITTSGLGEAHPVASNATPAGRAQNRRVEIDIVEAPA
jgi:chemotaxis protein MotB